MIKTLLIVYHERLGDIVRCLPIARHFAMLGWHVWIECRPQYHGIFDCVTYCYGLAPDERRGDFTRIIDLQIWPKRFDDFTRSGKNWMDYVYGLFPEGKDIDRQILLAPTKGEADEVPAWVHECCLVFPNGYSQMNPPNPFGVLIQAHKTFPTVPVIAVGKAELDMPELPSIPTLVAWIEAAKHVLTVNTSASIIASAVRKEWHHIPDLNPQHDWTHPNQVRVGRLT